MIDSCGSLIRTSVSWQGSWGGVSHSPDSYSKSRHTSKMTAPCEEIIWIHFCIAAGSRGVSSIFIYSECCEHVDMQHWVNLIVYFFLICMKLKN